MCLFEVRGWFFLVGISDRLQETLSLLSTEGGELCINLLVVGEFSINPSLWHEL